MHKLKLIFLRCIICTLVSVGSSTEAGIYYRHHSPGCISYYGRETGLSDLDSCLILCDRKEDCVGVAVENTGQKVNCYFLVDNKSDSKLLNPSSQAQIWFKGKKSERKRKVSFWQILQLFETLFLYTSKCTHFCRLCFCWQQALFFVEPKPVLCSH